MRHATVATPSCFAPRAKGSLAALTGLWSRTLIDQAKSISFKHFCAYHLQALALQPVLILPSSPRREAHPFGMESR